MISADEKRSAQHAASEAQLVASNSELAETGALWRRRSVLGVDTEFLRERTFRAELGLVQISDARAAWLIDPLHIAAPETLTSLLDDASVTKIFHSASEDLDVLWQTFAVSPAPMIDTQIACAMLGQPLQQSYHNAVKWLCGVELAKEHTRSNWLKRPLTAAQLHYAASDVVFLPLLYRELRKRLEALERWSWVVEDVEHLRAQSRQPLEPHEAYLRVRGAGRLDQDGLRVLRALAAWRERTAAMRNLARGFVIPDAVLLQLATAKPTTREALHGVPDLHDSSIRRDGSTIIRLVHEGMASDAAVADVKPLDNRQKRLLDRMRAAVRRTASSLGIDPALLASRRTLEELVRGHAQGSEPPERLLGWRRSIVTEELLEILN